MNEPVQVLFASATEELIPRAIEHARAYSPFPSAPLVVVSEFRPEGEQWAPFYPSRSFWDNLSYLRWYFRGQDIRLCSVMLQPHKPYWRMRWIAFLLAPTKLVLINEYFGHFRLHAKSAGTLFRHLRWRLRGFLAFQLRPGGDLYTYVWRVFHPHSLARPAAAISARVAGAFAAACRSIVPRKPLNVAAPASREPGISVVIPSRNGRALLEAMLPETVRQVGQAGGEIIVVDNGSDDGSGAFLRETYPRINVVQHAAPLSFARAANAGIRAARYSHVCLLNNDMSIGPDFFAQLRQAFTRVPDLFCATAQIFFPEGVRREETGKAVMPFAEDRKPLDFPVRCEPPIDGEDLSYVLYGSGGCSMFDAGKLDALEGLDESFEPAYVEDLDLGFRGWRQGWPSVFVAGAQVVHRHRATTSRYYSAAHLAEVLERNYLRFLARTVADSGTFGHLWLDAVRRLNLGAALEEPDPAATKVLADAWRAPLQTRRHTQAVLPDEHIVALGSGAVSVTPGRGPSNRPVVLVVSSYLPFPLSHGGAVRMFNLMRRAARDFDLVLISFAEHPGKIADELLALCCEIVQVKRSGTHCLPSTHRPDMVEEFDSPAYRAALRQTVRKWQPAVAQIEFTQMAQYAQDCAPARTILVEHDVTFDLYQQMLAQGDDWELRRQLKRWIPFETEAWRQVDRVAVMSEKDRAMTEKHGLPASRAVCLPNGVDLERFRPAGCPPDPRRMLFIGSFAHLPNILAVDFFLREAWPRLDCLKPQLHIIGGARHQYHLSRYRNVAEVDLAQPGIETEDFVTDVRPAYERAAIVIAPLLVSAGTNIKILEAMAMGKAIVSTPAGVNGLDLEPGADFLLANNASEMAAAISELMTNPERRACLERHARATVERKYDWDAIAAAQKALYDGLIAQGRTAALEFDTENGVIEIAEELFAERRGQRRERRH